MLRWSEMERASGIVLAVWPHYRPLYGRWFMQELLDRGNQPPAWRDRYIPGEDDSVQADHYPDRSSALTAADALNADLQANTAARVADGGARRSAELKVEKALLSKRRLHDEERLMFAEARRRHAGDERPDPASLRLHSQSESYRQDLGRELSDMPYLRIAQVGGSEGRWGRRLLFLNADGSWSKPYVANEKSAVTSERAKIANGFALSAAAHWGRTKARIRQILLPRANQLLQLASVQRMLAEALARGERVIVSNGIVFWYEEDGTVGWRVKEVASTSSDEGATIWREGTIRSINHGRLVILPYVKEDGEQVRGHTRNGPNDGPALPRHPQHFLDIPFSYYEGDLMIGLFGELPYE